jgi:hypothetical protein
MKVWITKYALSKGIIETQAELVSDWRIRFKWPTGESDHCYVPHWYTSREAAVARAEVMRTAKHLSLRKSIAKLESLKF